MFHSRRHSGSGSGGGGGGGGGDNDYTKSCYLSKYVPVRSYSYSYIPLIRPSIYHFSFQCIR